MFSRFGGGIHPPEHKSITEELKFVNLPIPHTCYIPLQQHVGAPAKLAVNVGDLVTEGQLIGRADGLISANVHSSIPGKVAAIATVRHGVRAAGVRCHRGRGIVFLIGHAPGDLRLDGPLPRRNTR